MRQLPASLLNDCPVVVQRMNPNNRQIILGSLRLDVDANQIFQAEKCFQVEPKIAGVIHYLYKNKNKVISRESLIAEVWQGQVISDNAISRSISQIRKLLSLSNQPAPIIETIPKVGYRLVIDTVESSITNKNASLIVNHSLPEKSVYKNKSRGFDFASLKVVLFIVFSGTIFISYLWQGNELSHETVEFNQTTLTHSPGIEKLAAFSPDGDFVVYAHAEKDSGDEFLILMDLETKQARKITQDASYLLKLAWSPDSTKIIYSYWKNVHDRQCGVNIIHFDSKKNLLSNEKLMDCSERALVNLAWNESGEKIYFNSRPSFDRPYSVHSYSFASKRRAQLTLPPQQGNFRGDYFIVGNLSGSRILVVRYLGYTKMDLRVYDTSDDRLISSNILMDNITGISWLGNSESVLLKIENKLYRYNHTNNSKQFYYPTGKHATGFFTDSNAYRMLFIRSNLNINLYTFDLLTGQQIEKVTRQTSDEIMPSYANTTNSVVYLSDRSGNMQIWMRDEVGQSFKLSDSPISIERTPLNWSPNDQFILFQHQDEIYSLNVNKHSIERIIDSSHKAYVANWSWSGEAVFYSSEKTGEWQIWQYILSSGKHIQITFDGGYSAKQHQNGDLYFSKIHQPGMWKLSSEKSAATGFSEQKIIFENFDGTNWISWQLDGNDIYYISAEEQGRGLFRYNILNQGHHLVFPFDEKHLNHFSVKGNHAIFSILDNRESSVELLQKSNK